MVQAEEVGSGTPRAVGPFLTVREVAATLRVSTATVYDLCETGKLVHIRANNAIRVGKGDLRAFLQNSRKEVNHARRIRKR